MPPVLGAACSLTSDGLDGDGYTAWHGGCDLTALIETICDGAAASALPSAPPDGAFGAVVEAVDPEVPDVWLPGVAPALSKPSWPLPASSKPWHLPVPVLAVPVLAVPVLAVPVLAVPVLAGPVLAVELFVEVLPRRCAGTCKCTGGGAFGVGGVVTFGGVRAGEPEDDEERQRRHYQHCRNHGCGLQEPS